MNIPWSCPFTRWWVPVGPLRPIGAREGQIGRIHLGSKNRSSSDTHFFCFYLFIYLGEKIKINANKRKLTLTKGGMIPRYWGNPGPTGGWGKGRAGLPAGGFLGGPWFCEFGGGTPAAPSITRAPPVPPSVTPSPGRVGARARPPPSRQLVTSEDSEDRRGQSG